MSKTMYILGMKVPLWAITGLSLFIIFSVGYDLVVGDRNGMRYALLGASALILLMSVILHFTSKRTLTKQARRQLGS